MLAVLSLKWQHFILSDCNLLKVQTCVSRFPLQSDDFTVTLYACLYDIVSTSLGKSVAVLQSLRHFCRRQDRMKKLQ